MTDAQRREKPLVLRVDQRFGLRDAQKRAERARPVGKTSDQRMHCARRGQIQNAADQNKTARLPVLGKNLAAAAKRDTAPKNMPRARKARGRSGLPE